MKNKASALLFFFLALAACIPSCTKDETGPIPLVLPSTCDSSAMSYQADIIPIMNRNCAYSGCHYPGSGNYDYTQYAVLADRIRSGRLEERIVMDPNEPLHMPQGFTMDSCELYKLRLWIHQGFQNN
jgi:hypothetical protein